MTTQANSRIWAGSTLSVSMDGSTWVDFAKCIDYSIPGVAAPKIDASTAGSTIEDFRLGIVNRGQATFNVFDFMDSPFLQALDTMQDGALTKKFKLTIPEGTKKNRLFNAYVIQQPITGSYNKLWQVALTLKVVNDYWWNANLTAASLSPSTGAAAGGTVVTVTGTGFVDGATSITIGGNPVAVADVTVVSSTSLTFATPAHAAGAVTVTVTSPEKTTTAISGGFTYT